MDARFASHFRRASLAVIATALTLIATPSAVGSQRNPMYFTGGGFGPTADVAIQGAVWDAEGTASLYQLYNCQVDGEILIFTRSSPRFGRNFNAQVMVACTS
jgi:hypothetical protein